MARASRAALTASKDNDRFIASIEKQVGAFGLAGTSLLRYEASLRGISDRVNPLADKLDKLKAAAVMAPAAAANASSYARGLGEITLAAEHSVHGTSAMTRELLVLGHEASQGNWKRLGGSFVVLGELGYAAAGRVLLAFAPLIVLGAAVAAVAAAFVVGVRQSIAFRDGMILTGNAAGLTAGTMDALSRSVGENAKISVTSARSIIQELAKTGEVGPRLIGPMAEAVARVAKVSGETAETVSKDFAKMGDGVLKWALEHNKQFHAFSFAQLEYVKGLEEQGRKEDAEGEVLKTLNARMGELTPKLSYMAQRWHELGEAAGQAWDIMAGTGRVDTLEDKLAKADKVIDAARKRQEENAKRPAFFQNAFAAAGDPRLVSAQDDKAFLQEQLRMQKRGAAVEALQAQQHKGGGEAVAYYAKLDEERKGATRLDKDLAELEAARQKRIADGGAAHTPEDAQREAYIRHHDRSFSDKAGEKLQSEFDRRLQSLREEGIKLDHETAQFATYGKSIDKARVAMVELEVAQGKFKNLTAPQKQQLIAEASKDDAKDKLLEEAKARAKATDEVSKYIGKIRDETAETQANARERDLAIGLTYIEQRATALGTEATVEDREAMRLWIGVKHDQMLVRKLAAEQLTVDDEVHKLQVETASLGMTTEARKEAAAVLRIYNAARADEKANPGQQQQILDAEIKKTRELTAEMRRNYEASRTFEIGASTAFERYRDDASNAGKFADTVVTGGLKNMEDALVTFAKTGKLSFSSLFQFMADEFIRQQIRMAVASQTSGLGSILSGLIGTAVSMYTGSYNQNYSNEGRNYSSPITGTGASGGQALAGHSYIVGERGPERLTMGNAAGNITPNGVAGLQVHIHNNAGAQVDTKMEDGKLHILLEQVTLRAANMGADMGHGRVVSEIHRGGAAAQAVQSRFGLGNNLQKRA